jgi:hypothetical protein
VELEELLAPVAGQFDIEDALSSWRWLVPQPMRALAMTAMGDLFLLDEDDAVWWLDAINGTCEQVAASQEELEVKLTDPELADEWFMTPLVLELRDVKPLKKGECYSPIHTPALGGSFEPENFEPCDWSVHLAFAGSLHEQLKDLPPGTRITKISYTEL